MNAEPAWIDPKPLALPDSGHVVPSTARIPEWADLPATSVSSARQDALPRPHPTNPKSSARVGDRRMTTEMSAKIPRLFQEDAVLEQLREPVLRTAAAQRARFHFQTVNGVTSSSAPDFDVPSGEVLQCVRRIGSYQGAEHRGGLFACLRDGTALALPYESILERSWLMTFDHRREVVWQQTQPFVITWHVDDRGLYRVPDVLLRTRQGWVVVDVKPQSRLAESPYTQAVYALTRDTLARAGVAYAVVGDVSHTRKRQLEAISRWRVVGPRLAACADQILRERPGTLGGIFDAVGDPNAGHVVALHLMSLGVLVVDLDAPLTIATATAWVVL